MHIVTKIMGGLGNQMFQYAAGRALALRLHTELQLDAFESFPVHEGDMPRRYMLAEAFAVSANFAGVEECARLKWREESRAEEFIRRLRRHQRPYADTFVQEPHFAYWPGIETVSAPAYLHGYWQNENYFSTVADIIRQDFSFPALPAGGAVEVGADIRAAGTSVCIHVRRGDYVLNPATSALHGTCSPEYYKRALQEIAAKTDGPLKLFLFSDDAAWAREHFDCQGFPSVIVDFTAHIDAPWHDMHLMSLCKHHIIANSSFSWWGAWLNANENKLVVAPKRWFQHEEYKQNNPALPEWHLIDDTQ